MDRRSDASSQILVASRAGQFLDCQDGTDRGVVDAAEIRRACLMADNLEHSFGVRVANAHITGRLDLSTSSVAVPLHLLGCALDEAPVFEGADLHELAIVDGAHGDVVAGAIGSSHLPGLLANGVRIRRDLVLSGTAVTGAHATSASLSRTAAIWLTEAEISGRLLAVGTTIDTDGDRSLQADRTEQFIQTAVPNI